ncbi:hypothetical protein BGZ46_002843 [Entomortierella lignicola]|nr:hypothetical protein BGZ46_002843 [Entomortierella lignicola]
MHNELTNIISLRDPSRNNQFSILAKARLGDQLVLLQQSHLDHDRNGMEKEEWLETLNSEPRSTNASHLLRVWGLLAKPLPSVIIPKSVPGSFAGSFSLERPIYVVSFCERGSLRDCLDQGQFLSRSNLSAKIKILKDVATALHYIKRTMYGQQHGAVSSSSVFIEKDGNAYLSWHRVNGSKRDFATGSCQDWRWFSPTAILQMQDKLAQGTSDPSAMLELEYDDMYSFGILAWEIITEELPFEDVLLPHSLGPNEVDGGDRFLKEPPPALRRLIQQCTRSDKDKRPSWCDVLKLLESLTGDTIESIADIDSDADTTDMSEASSPAQPVPLSQDKSNVVAMMESALTSTFYRKELPAHLISITSVAGRKLFREMMLAGTSECFFSIFTSFNTQSDPAFCGVSSLSMVLNALEIDPRRQWRGVWRWYSEEHLDCCASIDVMKQKGITFNQFWCLAKCHAEVVAKPAENHTLEEFRRDVQTIASSEGSHIVLSFSRAALGQTGSGHFSPIGGYHAEEDKVLVLDCARFKYPPFYATIQELWESFQPIDPETGKCRGYFLITTTARQKLDIQKRQLQLLMKESEAGAISSISMLSTGSSAYSSINPSRSSSPIPHQPLDGSDSPHTDLHTAKDNNEGSSGVEKTARNGEH